MELQPIFNIAELCHQAGISDAILSPGSRCAPLVMAFARHPGIVCRTIPDERTAGFIALGIAQSKRKPVVLICTSGSAAYNYAPAVSEAYFRNIPLLVITADRPPEWIGQQDGQTIFQDQLYGKHVRYSQSALADLTHPDAKWHLKRIVNEALRACGNVPYGPAHINIPFREPFYPEHDEETFYESENLYVRESRAIPYPDNNAFQALEKVWMESERKLILIGQSDLEEPLRDVLSHLSDHQHIPVVGDIISNVHKVSGSIQLADSFLNQDHSNSEGYVPDLVITVGLSFLSKNIKKFFRDHPVKAHWHIQEAGEVADPFRSVTDIIWSAPELVLKKLSEVSVKEEFGRQRQENYQKLLSAESDRVRRKTESFFSAPDEFGEFEIVYEALRHLPANSNLHLANSMAVRYANYCGIDPLKQNIQVFSNRGTCGIDGCTSTAAGTAIAEPDKLNILITGDVGFFYDRNAFWHNYSLDNLRVILLNNHGGGIFRMIQGPSQLPELEPFFETSQPLTARSLATEFRLEYLHCDKRSKIGHFLKELMSPDKRGKILEIESASIQNTEILGRYKQSIR